MSYHSPPRKTPARPGAGSAKAAGIGDPAIRTQLPVAIPVTDDEIKVLDQLLGSEIARLFEEESMKKTNLRNAA